MNGFGDEWERFDQSELDQKEALNLFNSYFAVFPWQDLPEKAKGFDLGCGSGRWQNWLLPGLAIYIALIPFRHLLLPGGTW